MKRFAISLSFLIAAALLGCSTMRVNIDYDSEIDFTRYQSFRWLEMKEPRQKMGMKKHPLAHRRIRRAVEQELYAKGYNKVTGLKPDFLITYHMGAKKKIDVVHHGYRYGRWGRFRGHRVSVHKYREGTLVLDIIDGYSRELAWRGSAKDVLQGAGGMSEHIDESVRKLLGDFPPE